MDSVGLVVTSIGSSDLPAMTSLDDGCAREGWAFYVVGDAKSPKNYRLKHGEFLDRSSHQSLPWRLGRSIPSGNYSLKNLGYLTAIAVGHECIVETDDDNIPRFNFWVKRQSEISAYSTIGEGWANVYLHFSEERVWPRGLPLDEVRTRLALAPTSGNIFSPVQMSLADDNPDVDAIYRLVGDLPITFASNLTVSCGRSWTPFNSQNTTWFPAAYPLMYLPTTCSFRMTDIWRSFVAQAWMLKMEWSLTVLSPTVYQVRNEHNLMQDFEQEVSGYLHNKAVMDSVTATASRFSNVKSAVWDYLYEAYATLVAMGLVEPGELKLVEDWVADFHLAIETL